jgi:prepilin-type processing-associated H-X9-DG protein
VAGDNILFWEPDETQTSQSAWGDGNNEARSDRLTARHGQGGNIVSADGHTESMTPGQFLAEANKKDPAGNWYHNRFDWDPRYINGPAGNAGEPPTN